MPLCGESYLHHCTMNFKLLAGRAVAVWGGAQDIVGLVGLLLLLLVIHMITVPRPLNGSVVNTKKRYPTQLHASPDLAFAQSGI